MMIGATVFLCCCNGKNTVVMVKHRYNGKNTAVNTVVMIKTLL